jgi:1,2-phenylacetyl-CoA epoxidase catalytic subunit
MGANGVAVTWDPPLAFVELNRPPANAYNLEFLQWFGRGAAASRPARGAAAGGRAMSVTRSVEWGVLLGMRKVETVEQMPEEYRQVLLKLIHALASTEFASVEQHQPWINQGPTAEDRYIQAQIAADEAHQGFQDCRLLRAFGADGAAMADDLLRRRRGEHLLDAFNLPFDSWVDTVTFCFTMDLVAWYHLRAMENCSYAPLAREMTSMVHEEKFHASFGARRATDLVRDPDYARLVQATRDDVQAALNKWYPRALDTFGRSDSRVSELAVAYGIRRWGNAELRRMYKQDIDQQIRGLDLEVPPEDRDRKIL